MMTGKFNFLVLSVILTSLLIRCDANPPKSIGGRIAGGTEATRSMFNFQVVMFIELISNNESLCSGSILSTKYILSAAHCFQNFVSADILGGLLDFAVDDPEYEVTVFPSEVKNHEQYNSANFVNDIAMVSVAKQPIQFSTKLQPVKLAPKALVNVDLTNRSGRLAGWGATETGAPSSRLLFIENPIISSNECIRVFGNGFTNNNVCMSGASGRSACPGDSGGPLTIDYNGNRVQVGIVSFGSQTSCVQGYPVVFTKVANFLSWIESKTDLVIA